jgi:hypothetical protein
MIEDTGRPRVDAAAVHVRCPSLAPGAYLAWASWWHTVNSSLLELALDADVRDVEIVEQVRFWDRLLARLEIELPHAVFGTDPIAPIIRSTPREASNAARVARSRLAWLRDAELVMLRPDADVARSMDALITALDAVAEPRPAAHLGLAMLAR